MAYLHSDREQFRDVIDLAYEQTGVMVQAIEKDYYVTMLLRLLAQKMPYIVFKGGTSLSKCHKVIRRFSEDIDITIDTLLSQGQKKKIKQAIVDSAEELGMTIENLDGTRSRCDYIIDPPAAKIVRRIFDLAILGLGTRDIAMMLNDENIPVPSVYNKEK